mmetsp:Transcript_73263/g.226267  ORF Transcript_73263/g.226267 Transcript_73263/m.226267 type:complete len:280 (+) Transcript_73263:470-1309(+)
MGGPSADDGGQAVHLCGRGLRSDLRLRRLGRASARALGRVLRPPGRRLAGHATHADGAVGRLGRHHGGQTAHLRRPRREQAAAELGGAFGPLGARRPDRRARCRGCDHHCPRGRPGGGGAGGGCAGKRRLGGGRPHGRAPRLARRMCPRGPALRVRGPGRAARAAEQRGVPGPGRRRLGGASADGRAARRRCGSGRRRQALRVRRGLRRADAEFGGVLQPGRGGLGGLAAHVRAAGLRRGRRGRRPPPRLRRLRRGAVPWLRGAVRPRGGRLVAPAGDV